MPTMGMTDPAVGKSRAARIVSVWPNADVCMTDPAALKSRG